MWTSERSRRPLVREAAAETGEVTLGGGQAGVILGGERRWTALCCPGGYTWRPAAGDRVLVLKAGGEQESPFILGVETDGSDLAPGEVRLSGGSSTLQLGQQDILPQPLSGEPALQGVLHPLEYGLLIPARLGGHLHRHVHRFRVRGPDLDVHDILRHLWE